MNICGKKFVWGDVVALHEIGEYIIVEYTDSKHELSFHGYINQKDTNTSWSTLDEALVGLVAYKWDGCNSQAAGLFCRSMEMYKEDK